MTLAKAIDHLSSALRKALLLEIATTAPLLRRRTASALMLALACTDARKVNTCIKSG